MPSNGRAAPGRCWFVGHVAYAGLLDVPGVSGVVAAGARWAVSLRRGDPCAPTADRGLEGPVTRARGTIPLRPTLGLYAACARGRRRPRTAEQPPPWRDLRGRLLHAAPEPGRPRGLSAWGAVR